MKLEAIAAACLIVAAPAHAQLIADSDEPIHVSGVHSETVDNVMTISGDVLITQGAAVLSAREVVATMTGDRDFENIRAIGEVRYSNGERAVTGDEGVYDAAERTITMTGDVVLTEGEDVVTGGRLIYWIDTGRVLFTAPEGRRIRGIFYTDEAGQSL